MTISNVGTAGPSMTVHLHIMVPPGEQVNRCGNLLKGVLDFKPMETAPFVYCTRTVHDYRSQKYFLQLQYPSKTVSLLDMRAPFRTQP